MAISIYVGANEKKLGIRQYQIFAGDYPEHVQSAIKANPGLANLFVPFDVFITQPAPGTPKRPANPVQKVAPRQGPPIRNQK
jgi:hypothetical protein